MLCACNRIDRCSIVAHSNIAHLLHGLPNVIFHFFHLPKTASNALQLHDRVSLLAVAFTKQLKEEEKKRENVKSQMAFRAALRMWRFALAK